MGEEIHMDRNQIRAVLGCCVSLFAMAMPGAGYAQSTGSEASTQQTAAAAEDNADQYAIVVTARRRQENLQDVPLAISVLGDAALKRENIVDVAGLGAAVPGLVVGNSIGGGRSTPTFAIRGQSQQELSGIADPSVSLYINDIAVPRAQGANTGFFDVGGVEVAKGPQGTLFGRNTTGGAIILRTQRPEQDFSAYLSQTVGNLKTFATEAVVNVPLGDVGALRVAGQHYQRGGFLTDTILNRKFNTINEDAIRASLKLNLGERITNETTFQYSNTDNGGTGGYVTYSLNAAFAAGLAARATRGFYETESGVPMYTDVNTYHVDNTTTFELNDQFKLKNIFGYRDMNLHNMEDLDGTQNLLFPVERIVEQHQASNEIQLQGTFDRFNFILGGYYFREKGSDQALTAGALAGVGAADPGLIEPSDMTAYHPRYSNTWVGFTNTSYALFLQGDFKVTDAFTLTAGVRQNWDKRHADIYNRAYISAVSTTDLSCRFTLDQDNNAATPETRPNLAGCHFVGDAKFDEMTYNASLQYQPTDGVMVYLAHRHGYRTGGFGARGNSQATLGDTFSPEKVDDLELGIKADWDLGDTFVRTNLAAYSAKYKDMQRILLLNPPGSAPVTLTTNAGRAKIQGIEFEAIIRPSPVFELSGFYTFTDAKFQEYVGPNGDDLSGQIFPRAPRHSYSLTASLMPPIDPSKGDIRLSVTYRYQSKYDYNDDYALERTLTGTALPNGVLYNQAQTIEAQRTLSANLDWKQVMGSNFDLAVFGENLTNRRYLLPYMGISGVYETRTPAAPRTVGLRVTARFN